jgi:hypothetical protein
MSKTNFILVAIIGIFGTASGWMYNHYNQSSNDLFIEHLDGVIATKQRQNDSLHIANDMVESHIYQMELVVDSLKDETTKKDYKIGKLNKRLNEISNHNFHSITDSVLLNIFERAKFKANNGG